MRWSHVGYGNHGNLTLNLSLALRFVFGVYDFRETKVGLISTQWDDDASSVRSRMILGSGRNYGVMNLTQAYHSNGSTQDCGNSSVLVPRVTAVVCWAINIMTNRSQFLVILWHGQGSLNVTQSISCQIMTWVRSTPEHQTVMILTLFGQNILGNTVKYLKQIYHIWFYSYKSIFTL